MRGHCVPGLSLSLSLSAMTTETRTYLTTHTKICIHTLTNTHAFRDTLPYTHPQKYMCAHGHADEDTQICSNTQMRTLKQSQIDKRTHIHMQALTDKNTQAHRQIHTRARSHRRTHTGYTREQALPDGHSAVSTQ